MIHLTDAFTTTDQTIALLDAVRAGQEASEELSALRVEDADYVAWEHRAPQSEQWYPLLEHARSAVARYLRGIETAVDPFEDLNEDRFTELCSIFELLRHYGIGRQLRCALVHLDFAKGGTADQRAEWLREGVDLTVHNCAAATILADSGLGETLDWDPVRFDLALAMIANHGLAGQHVRGETPRGAFRAWVSWLRANGGRLADALGVTETQAVTLSCNALHMIDVCDTAAVRPGLMTDRLHAELTKIRDLWIAAVDDPDLLAIDDSLRERFLRLRRIANHRGESEERIGTAVGALPAAQRAWVDELLPRTQLWYFEPATHRMSSDAALKLLFLGLAHAQQEPTVNVDDSFHLSFQPLADLLGAPTSTCTYRVRLVEALLSLKSYEELERGEFPSNLLGAFLPRIGGTTAVALELDTTDEADALLTLLSIYERRSSVAFHQILKLLCDAYGLRKDEFDRLSNEAQYLETMNAARSDKERMIDFVQPQRIVEIGPGGGVVLDLLAARFDGAEIVGVDVSEVAVEELRRRQQNENRPWRVVHGDAYELPDIFGERSVDTVLFCSVLHEIFSYVERDGRKFNLKSIEQMLQSAYSVLKPNGRIVIRDGVKPPPGERVIEFLDPDGPDFLRRFVAEFEGRDIAVQWLNETAARLSTADAMEFLYCYTWGPASFPYEVREQYGVMEWDEYGESVSRWLGSAKPPVRTVEIPDDLKSYLQPGYEAGLADKIRLFDESGAPARLPDSNALWVFEKPG